MLLSEAPMSFRERHIPERLMLNLRLVLDASGLSNGAISRVLTERGRRTDPSTVSRWRSQVNVPADLRPLSEWSGVPERTLSYGTEAQVQAAIAQAKLRGGLAAPSPQAPPVPATAESAAG